jgi:hypothetical protein
MTEYLLAGGCGMSKPGIFLRLGVSSGVRGYCNVGAQGEGDVGSDATMGEERGGSPKTWAHVGVVRVHVDLRTWAEAT